MTDLLAATTTSTAMDAAASARSAAPARTAASARLAEPTPLLDARSQLAEAITLLGYADGLHQMLATPRRELTVAVPLRMDSGESRLYIGYRVQHNFSRGPAKGGLRYAPNVNIDDPREHSMAELERVTRRYTSEILPIIGPERDIPAPDIGTDEQTMAWIMDTYSVNSGYTVPGIVTGKPISLGGSLGRASATSRGVTHIALAALRHAGLDPARSTAAVQGFGKVGADAARFLAEAGVRVTAVSDQYGAVSNDGGLDIEALNDHVRTTGSVVGFAGADALDGGALLTQDVDLLVPAAVEGVLHEGNAGDVLAAVIVEGANGPTTPGADRILRERGVLVVPDILANAGGVIVSYFEWVQANQAYWWRADEVESRLEERMLSAWQHVLGYAEARDLSLRTAATALAVERVAEAHRLRGLYP
jgi:glutamate dehydrogenase (NAD(P)+)